jgi:hypothetical protein
MDGKNRMFRICQVVQDHLAERRKGFCKALGDLLELIKQDLGFLRQFPR